MKARRPAGFTLLEVLIAISIFAIAISIVYGLYTSIISVVHNVEDHTDLNLRVRTAFTRLSRDLHGLYRGEQGYLHSVDSINPFADEPILEFSSRAHLAFNPESDPVPLAIIRYYLEPEEEDETYLLIRSDTPIDIGAEEDELAEDEYAEARKFVLCRGLKEVRLNYFDREGEGTSEWDTREGDEDEQEDDGRFPALVDIELVFLDGTDAQAEGALYSTAVFLRPGLLDFAGVIDE